MANDAKIALGVSKFVITGGTKLEGKVKVAGSKNSALALLPAALLADSAVTLTNVPNIRDIEIMTKLIAELGGRIEASNDSLTIDPSGLASYELNSDLSGRLRASVILAAPLLVRFGKAVITPPGGDQIGERLLDTHFSMMREFGINVAPADGKFHLTWEKRKAPRIFLEEASVTATEMGLILASTLNADVTLEDAAAEPHVQDLAKMLTKMGAKISGAGTNRILVSGKKRLSGVLHRVVPDHIDGGTFAIAAAITGGHVEIEDCPEEHYHIFLHYLKSMGVQAECEEGDRLCVKPSNLRALKRKFQTRPWPGFPTDLMSTFIVLATQTDGTVLCHDWMYEWRVFFVDDLISMGANIFIADPHRVIVTGPTKLKAEKLFCKDIRAGISIILAALVAKGESEIENAEMVERGYEKIVERFKALGGEIRKEESPNE
ncbi:MAG: UDP-N-acetylglucosamine 1-carboxyvinyltransferase [Patescibacteria group bacterium]